MHRTAARQLFDFIDNQLRWMGIDEGLSYFVTKLGHPDIVLLFLLLKDGERRWGKCCVFVWLCVCVCVCHKHKLVQRFVVMLKQVMRCRGML